MIYKRIYGLIFLLSGLIIYIKVNENEVVLPNFGSFCKCRQQTCNYLLLLYILYYQ